MDKKNYFKIGNINKVNRKTGEISIALENTSFTFGIELEKIFIEIDGGLVPFFIDRVGVINSEMLRLILEDYSSPDLAQRFVGCKVYLPTDESMALPKSSTVEIEDIIGFSVVDDILGEVGVINDVFESPQQVLLQIFKGKTEILIPFVEEFLVEIDIEKRVIRFNLPEGLIDINLEKY